MFMKETNARSTPLTPLLRTEFILWKFERFS